MSTRALSGWLVLGNSVLVALVFVIFVFVIAPAQREGRPFRRAQMIGLALAVLAMAGATWNAIITFSS